MKLTEAKLKALILEAMEESLSDGQKEFLLDLLKSDDRETQTQGVELATQFLGEKEFSNAFRGQLDFVNGAELLNWLRQGSSRGPRQAMDRYMEVPDGMSKEKREFQLRFPNAAWREPISDKAHETWVDRVQQMQSKLVSLAMSGNFVEWEKQWFAFKDFLGSFYEIHAPGFWPSLTDSEQMGAIYGRIRSGGTPRHSTKSFGKAQGMFDPSWRLAMPLAHEIDKANRDR